MTAQDLRSQVFAHLETLGFRPAKSLPFPDLDQPIRPATEVAARLMALDALFTWVAFPEQTVATARIDRYIDRNWLRDWLTKEESEIIGLSRMDAYTSHVDNIGWKLENMWALAWVLGFEPEPDLQSSQIREEITQSIIYDFLPGLDSTIDVLLAKHCARSSAEVIAMEYRFYCAHNAVRSAQLGGATVPDGFHPVAHGGALHERRHSLSWCTAPGVPWDETELST
jgi:hypothetical protein